MVNNTLRKKLFRDMSRAAMQFLSIIALCALGIPPSPHIRSSWNLPNRTKLMMVFNTCAMNQLRSDAVKI